MHDPSVPMEPHLQNTYQTEIYSTSIFLTLLTSINGTQKVHSLTEKEMMNAENTLPLLVQLTKLLLCTLYLGYFWPDFERRQFTFPH